MFKFKKTLLLAVLFICAVAFSVHAAVTVATMGAPDSSGNYPVVVDSDNYVTFNGGIYAKYEILTTDDTLTAAESGKTIIVQSVEAKPATITLPDADVGLEFTFVQGITTAEAAGTKYMIIDPQDTDILVALNSDVENTFGVGDQIYNSNGYTGDSIRIICPLDLYWYVTDARGTWTDGD